MGAFLKRLTFDFETRSKADLRKQGAYKYSLDPTTQPTCLSSKVNGSGKSYFMPFKIINSPWRKIDWGFRFHWMNFIEEGYEFSAHNAFFERCIYENILVKRYGWPSIPFDQYRCTAAKAAACALPRNLAGAGEAMKLSVQKDPRGYQAMMKTCKPTPRWNAWQKARAELKAGKRIGPKKLKLASEPEPKLFLDYDDDPETWETLYEYCKIDVLAEEKLDDSLPDLMPIEQKIWQLNQTLNWRGIKVDIPVAHKVVDIMSRDSASRLKELDTTTAGLVTKAGAIKSILEFLALEGIELPNLRAKTVDDMLKDGKLNEDGRKLLEIRKALSKTSTKKYQAFLDRASSDHCVRDILLFHGASTGRDAGTGVQLHNLPKTVIAVTKDRPYAAIENVISCDEETLKLLYGQSLGPLFSSIIRNVIIPRKGFILFIADFSKIEVAVLWWLAKNWPGLLILQKGLDPYKYQAAANTGSTYESISDDGDERQLGKAQILGCGFGMGALRFQSTAWDQYRLQLSEKQSREAVQSYRQKNKAVPKLWEAYEEAAINAIEDGIVFKAGRCKFYTKNNFLWVQLPSGRKLAYRDPQIAWRVREYEAIEIHPLTGKEVRVKKFTEPKKTVEFWAVHPKTKKWALERTWGGTLTENIVQATARDLQMQASLRLEEAGYRVLLGVHDELICERKKGEGSVKEFERIMCERPEWADKDLPIQAKAWSGPRYRK